MGMNMGVGPMGMVPGGFPGGQNFSGLQPPVAADGGLTDPGFNQTVSQALSAAFGADPATNQVMPGPISHLNDALKTDFARAGMSSLGNLFPQSANSGGFPPGSTFSGNTGATDSFTPMNNTPGMPTSMPQGQDMNASAENPIVAALLQIVSMLAAMLQGQFQNPGSQPKTST